MVPPQGEGEAGRESLQKELLGAVRDCQSRFGGRKELATELDQHVQVLLASFERVFSHGLCNGRSATNSTLRQVTEKVLGGGQTGGGGSEEGGGSGGGSSYWLAVRCLLTQHEVSRFEELRQVWTERGRGRAWLRAAINERSLERTLLALLASPALLNEHYAPYAFLRDQERNSILPTAAAGLGSILFAISIDRPELNHCSNASIGGNRCMPHAEPVIPPPINVPGAKRSDGRRRKKISPNIISFDDDDDIEVTPSTPIVQPSLPLPSNEVNQTITIGVDCLESESTADIDSGIADSENELPSVGLRPLTNSSVGELIPVAMSEETHSSEDSLSVPSFSEDVECTGVVEEVATVVLVGEDGEEEESNYADDGDETSLQQQLQTERGVCAALRAQLNDCQKRLQDTDTTINTLNRENELLKHQLRKYVMAVQSIEQDERASLFEQKLVQVAEMHGELMEMNERLQRSLVAKEALVERLRQELEGVRGPLPTALAPASLVSLWLPSVFLSGDNSSDAHHVYQVHVRICAEEWNVYRRYAQFYALHKKLKKQYPIVSTFNFPPKKTIGNKEARFVEERRSRLQQYLRKVVDQLVLTQPELAAMPSKPLLISLLPFFGELASMEDKQKSGSKPSRHSHPPDSPHYTGL